MPGTLTFYVSRFTHHAMKTYIRLLTALFLALLITTPAPAQISVHPTGVNVNASGATVVFLTYGGLEGYVPTEAEWCGEIQDAFPDVGQRCQPGTIFGQLPLRSNFGRPSGTGGFTDIMSIPASVARRAYQSAQAGADSRFYYVRRFVPDAVNGPDVYVAVTCRLTGGGARTPFALLDVQMRFQAEAAVQTVAPGEALPPVEAEISYNGTGTLRGRWEVVLPGEEPPTERDLLTEATLPIEERGLQRRYTEVGRFSVFLPPSAGARFVLRGPDPEAIPNDVEGLYQLLLRIEASDDTEGDSNLAAAGAGEGVVHSGAVAGFPIPPLRYFVGASSGNAAPVRGKLYALLPEPDVVWPDSSALDFSWTETPLASLYRLEVWSGDAERILAAVLPASLASYRAPGWLREKASEGMLRWRVAAIGFEGQEIARTDWRVVRLGMPTP